MKIYWQYLSKLIIFYIWSWHSQFHHHKHHHLDNDSIIIIILNIIIIIIVIINFGKVSSVQHHLQHNHFQSSILTVHFKVMEVFVFCWTLGGWGWSGSHDAVLKLMASVVGPRTWPNRVHTLKHHTSAVTTGSLHTSSTHTKYNPS